MIDNVALELAKYRLEKAKDLLLQARILYKNEKYDGSINRSYYAIFNGIKVLLAIVKIDSTKHSGVLSYFDKYFVKTQIIDKQFSKIAHMAFDIRQENDYEDFYAPSKEESLMQLNDSELFIKEIEEILLKIKNKEIDLPETAWE